MAETSIEITIKSNKYNNARWYHSKNKLAITEIVHNITCSIPLYTFKIKIYSQNLNLLIRVW